MRPVRPLRWLKFALVAALLLAALALTSTFLISFRRASSTTETSFGSAATVAVPEKSIAVLPFENLSDEKENAYFADGVQDEILTGLARVADLKVISRTSVMQYKTGANATCAKSPRRSAWRMCWKAQSSVPAAACASVLS